MPFLSEKTLHIVDRVLWMLPFATNTDLNEAADSDISHESRNGFLQKLLDEHSISGGRQQLKELWGKWIETNYGAAGPESTGRGYGAEEETPVDSGDELRTKRPTMEARLPDLLLLPLRRSQLSQQLRLFSYELL